MIINIMTKEQTIQIKGIAILMMLFLHLFMSGQVAEMCSPVLFIGSTPLVQILTRSCTPVGIFLILSGYGLSYVYAHGKLNLAKQLKRLFKLYLHYWIILLVFVGIGCFVAPDKYPGSVLTILSNVTSWDTTYNAEIWFLFPYALLSLTAFAIFRVMDKIGNLASFILTGILYLAACAFISRYLAPRHLYHEVYSPIVTYFDLLFEFVLGAILYRMSDARIESFKHIFVKRRWLALLLLLVCFLLHLFTGFQGLNPIYCFCLILLLLQLLPPPFIAR